jgi:preprotein translocase subunit YajC
MWSDAYAQTPGAAAPAAAAPNPMIAMIVQFAPILLIFAIMYLLLIRPQQVRQKQLDQMLKNLKKGDRVATSGGILGTVVGVDEGKVVLRIADDVKVEFTKGSVTQVLPESGG